MRVRGARRTWSAHVTCPAVQTRAPQLILCPCMGQPAPPQSVLLWLAAYPDGRRRYSVASTRRRLRLPEAQWLSRRLADHGLQLDSELRKWSFDRLPSVAVHGFECIAAGDVHRILAQWGKEATRRPCAHLALPKANGLRKLAQSAPRSAVGARALGREPTGACLACPQAPRRCPGRAGDVR